MPKFETNQIDVSGDGRIILYQRPRPDGSIIPTWQMRISVPNSTGYHRSSTKEKDKSEAIRKARNTYEELYMKVMSGGSLKSRSFSQVYENWKVDLPRQEGANRAEHVIMHLRLVGNYPLRYFGDQKLDTIVKGSFVEYWMWRRENAAKLNPMTNKLTPYIPSPNTLRRESVAIKSMFFYAEDKGWLTAVPDMDIPPLDKARRPTFTLNEWRLLTRRMREWVKEGQVWGSVGRDRFVTQQYVLILANSGLRIGEARGMKWSDLRTQETGGGPRLVASVSGKTGEREAIFNGGSEDYVKRLYDLRKKEIGDDPPLDGYVICHKDGHPIQSLRKGFDRLLKYCDLENDLMGKKRSLYSLRHFYATQRLMDEVSPYLLATTMGTSVEMLQRFYGQVVSSLVATEITKTKGTRTSPKVGKNGYPFETSP